MGQTALFNTLKAYSVYDKRVGYCQGMGFIIALLLLYMTEEVHSVLIDARALSLSLAFLLTHDNRHHRTPSTFWFACVATTK